MNIIKKKLRQKSDKKNNVNELVSFINPIIIAGIDKYAKII